MKPSRLRYWKRTELIRRADATADDDGEPLGATVGQGEFDFQGLVGVRSILAMIESGVSIRRIRRGLEQLRERHPDLVDPVAALRLWAEGSDRIVLRQDGVLQEPDGQVVFDLSEPCTDVQDEVSTLTQGRATASPTLRSTAQTVIEWFERGCQLDSQASTYGEAIEAYETALSLDETFADAHCNLGAVHFNRGDRETARRHFRRCLELDPRHVEGHFNLANLLEEDGADEMALQHYRAALAVDATYPDLHINLALLHEKLGRATDARFHWRRYLQIETGGAWSEVARQRLEDPSR